MNRFAIIAGLGSAALLFGALGFQYLGDLAPCTMCIWQRWPHVIAMALAVAAFFGAPRALFPIAALAVIVGAGIAGYHAGVEQGWFEGPSTCTSGPIGQQSTSELLDQIMNAPLVRCDEIAWSFGGLSMAAWNGVASLGLAALWLLAWRQPSSSASQ